MKQKGGIKPQSMMLNWARVHEIFIPRVILLENTSSFIAHQMLLFMHDNVFLHIPLKQKIIFHRIVISCNTTFTIKKNTLFIFNYKCKFCLKKL